MRIRASHLLLALLALAAFPAAAGAAAPQGAAASAPAATAAPAAGTSGVVLVSKPGVKGKPARTLVFDPLMIEGRVPRPRAVVTFEHTRADFGDLTPDEDFLPKILDSVEGDPF